MEELGAVGGREGWRREWKVEHGRAKQINSWTEWEREIGNNKLKRKK
jgi:hypothetical protein